MCIVDSVNQEVHKETNEIQQMLSQLYPKDQMLISKMIDSILYCQECEEKNKLGSKIYELISMI